MSEQQHFEMVAETIIYQKADGFGRISPPKALEKREPMVGDAIEDGEEEKDGQRQ